MAHRAAPFSASMALGHASANAVIATAEGWSTGSSANFTFPLHSHMSSARREGSEYYFKVFGMTRPGLEPTTYRLWGKRSTTGPSLRLEGYVYCKKSKRRPRRMWIDDIKEWTNIREYGQLKRKAQCRDQWRSIIGNLRLLENATEIE